MRIVGLDIGQRRIGVAISDESRIIAQPVKVIQRKDKNTDLVEIKKIVSSFQVAEIIFGLPRNMNGSIGPQAEIISAFADEIAVHLSIPLKPWDERLTTVIAEKSLIEGKMRRKKRKNIIDSVAAILILQSYLDSQRVTTQADRLKAEGG